MTMTASPATYTLNNTLDDSSGNMKIAGALTLGTGNTGLTPSLVFPYSSNLFFDQYGNYHFGGSTTGQWKVITDSSTTAVLAVGSGGLITTKSNTLDDGSGNATFTSVSSATSTVGSTANFTNGPITLGRAGGGSSLFSLVDNHSGYSSTLTPGINLTANQTLTLPNSSGTIALTSQIPAASLNSYWYQDYSVSSSNTLTSNWTISNGSDCSQSSSVLQFTTIGTYDIVIEANIVSLSGNNDWSLTLNTNSGTASVYPTTNKIVYNDSANGHAAYLSWSPTVVIGTASTQLNLASNITSTAYNVLCKIRRVS